MRALLAIAVAATAASASGAAAGKRGKAPVGSGHHVPSRPSDFHPSSVQPVQHMLVHYPADAVVPPSVAAAAFAADAYDKLHHTKAPSDFHTPYVRPPATVYHMVLDPPSPAHVHALLAAAAAHRRYAAQQHAAHQWSMHMLHHALGESAWAAHNAAMLWHGAYNPYAAGAFGLPYGPAPYAPVVWPAHLLAPAYGAPFAGFPAAVQPWDARGLPLTAEQALARAAAMGAPIDPNHVGAGALRPSDVGGAADAAGGAKPVAKK